MVKLVRHSHSKIACALATALLSLSTYAQQASLENNKASTTEENIEIIQVFAQKRAQDIRDVSVAVTVINNETINRLQVKDTTQLATFVPNVKMTNNAGEGTPPAFNIRGVGMIDYNTSTISPIAVYSDGVAGGSANNLSVNLFDVEQVEVLRGPQGTLFGRNTTGGAILLRSNQPEDTFSGYFNASFATKDHQSINSAVNIPLTDNTAMRFAMNYEDYQFSTNNLMKTQGDGGLKQTNLRAIIKSEFKDITITAKVHSENWTGKPKPIASLGINKIDGSGLCTPSQAGSKICQDNLGGQVGGNDFWDVNADIADREHDTSSWGASLTLAWRLNNAITINAITAYNDLDRFHSWDSDGPGNLIEGSMATENSLFSQELSITIQGDDTYWVTGLYYVNEEIKQNNDIDLFRDFRAIDALAAIPAQFFYRNTLENTSLALYSQVDYTLNNTYTLTAGLRYTDEKTDYHTIADLDIVPAYIPELWNLAGQVSDGEFSGKLALNQKINSFTNVYYSYSRGYKSGGYNAGYTTSPAQAADSEYAPEILDAYEVGSRFQFWQQDANLNLAAFYYDYKDQQVFVNMTTGPAPYHVLKNAGNSTIYGFEAEFTITPTHNLQLNLNLGYLPKANMGNYQYDGVSVEDNRLPFASKWNASGYALYEISLWERSLISQLGFDYQSAFYFDQNENAYTEQDAFVTFYARMTLQFNEQLTFTLWGKNLSNTEYSELRFNSIAALGAITELKAESRQIGIEVAYSF